MAESFRASISDVLYLLTQRSRVQTWLLLFALMLQLINSLFSFAQVGMASKGLHMHKSCLHFSAHALYLGFLESVKAMS